MLPARDGGCQAGNTGTSSPRAIIRAAITWLTTPSPVPASAACITSGSLLRSTGETGTRRVTRLRENSIWWAAASVLRSRK